MRVLIPQLHWTTDKFIEIPAFSGVLITGAAMLSQSVMTRESRVLTAGNRLQRHMRGAGCVAVVLRPRRRLSPMGASRSQATHGDPFTGRAFLVYLVGVGYGLVYPLLVSLGFRLQANGVRLSHGRGPAQQATH
jgi:hypothetical protein